MKLLLAIVIIALVAVLGARLTQLRAKLPLGLRDLLLTGTEYIFLGLLLGQTGLEVLDAKTMHALEPAVLFGLGWVGFLFGLQFELKELRALPHRYFSITTVQALVTFALVAVVGYVALGAFGIADGGMRLSAALVLGSVACSTAPSALALVNRHHNIANKKLAELLRYVSGVDGVYALGFFSIAIGLYFGIASPERSTATLLTWAGVSFASGAVPALILISLNRMRFSHQEFLVFLIGTIMLCAGLSTINEGTPLVSGMLCGVITANFCDHRQRALNVVAHAERSMYVILLLLLGATWSVRIDFGLILMVVYFSVRLLGKVAGAFLGTRIFRFGYASPPYLGLGLLDEGGMAIAMIFSFSLIHAGPLSDALITVTVFAVVVSELIGPRLILRVLQDRGTTPSPSGGGR